MKGFVKLHINVHQEDEPLNLHDNFSGIRRKKKKTLQFINLKK